VDRGIVGFGLLENQIRGLLGRIPRLSVQEIRSSSTSALQQPRPALRGYGSYEYVVSSLLCVVCGSR